MRKTERQTTRETESVLREKESESEKQKSIEREREKERERETGIEGKRE